MPPSHTAYIGWPTVYTNSKKNMTECIHCVYIGLGLKLKPHRWDYVACIRSHLDQFCHFYEEPTTVTGRVEIGESRNTREKNCHARKELSNYSIIYAPTVDCRLTQVDFKLPRVSVNRRQIPASRWIGTSKLAPSNTQVSCPTDGFFPVYVKSPVMYQSQKQF